jgi:peptidoglycan/LPS O-acetylase OafA/YrhL
MAAHALPFAALPGWVLAPFNHGEAAVDLFFALSGLVIINALERFEGRFRPFARGGCCLLISAPSPPPFCSSSRETR